LGKYRKHHIPNLPQFWEKFYFRPGNLGYPVFNTAVGRVGVYICYDRHFPEGWRELGLNNAQIVFNPSATKPGLSNRLWDIEQPAAAANNQYFVAANNRIGREYEEFGEDAVTFYGTSYFVDPRGNFVGQRASQDKEELLVRDLDLDEITRARNDWQFYRDRRPESYTRTVQP
jgi:N-carbamoylputrescine amidase